MMRDRAADLALAARLKSGDQTAVAELTALYGTMVQQLAFRYMKSWEDAEEVTQDVIMKVVNKIDLFRGDSALSSWIYRITFNAAMSRLRNGRFSRPNEVLASDLAARRDERGGEAASAFEAADWSNLGDEAVLRRQLRDKVIAALREMPAVYRVPVVLRDLRGMSTEEASKLLRVKTQTLKSRLHRGRTFLRSRLQEFAGGISLHNTASA
jgi:RNA polymerase sigma-70 factor (ECF subfamily)